VSGAGYVAGSFVVGLASSGRTMAMCFVASALYFAIMALVSLTAIDSSLFPGGRSHPVAPAGLRHLVGSVWQSGRHVLRTRTLWMTFAGVALVGGLQFGIEVLFPVLSTVAWKGAGGIAALLAAALACGSMVGALTTGLPARSDTVRMAWSAGVVGMAAVLAGCAPWLWLHVGGIAALGAGAAHFLGVSTAHLQRAVSDEIRGGVMGLYALVLGTPALTRLLLGWIAASAAGPMLALVSSTPSSHTSRSTARIRTQATKQKAGCSAGKVAGTDSPKGRRSRR
jgi:hypothetical protein